MLKLECAFRGNQDKGSGVRGSVLASASFTKTSGFVRSELPTLLLGCDVHVVLVHSKSRKMPAQGAVREGLVAAAKAGAGRA